jgi:hypothetical protein
LSHEAIVRYSAGIAIRLAKVAVVVVRAVAVTRVESAGYPQKGIGPDLL